MNWGSIFYVIFISFLLVICTFTSIIYIALQSFKKIPTAKFSLTTVDYITYSVVALICGLSLFDIFSYFGLLAFLPLLLTKYLSIKILTIEQLSKKGYWLQVEWTKLIPKGFKLPNEQMAQINKELNSLPKDTHFIAPRFFIIIAINYLYKKMKKDKKMANQFNGATQKVMIDKLDEIVNNIKKLESSKTENFQLGFGLLKVTRH